MAGPGAGGVQDQQQAGVCHQLVHFQGGLLNKQKGPNKHINQELRNEKIDKLQLSGPGACVMGKPLQLGDHLLPGEKHPQAALH